MWVSGLSFNPFSHFGLCSGCSRSTHGRAWLRNKSCVREWKSNTHTRWDKALCSLYGSERKASPVIGVFTLWMHGCFWSHVSRKTSISVRRRQRLIGARSSSSETCPSTGGKLDYKWNFELLLTFSWEPNVAEGALEPLHRMHRNCSLCLRSCLIQTKFQKKLPFLVDGKDHV